MKQHITKETKMAVEDAMLEAPEILENLEELILEGNARMEEIDQKSIDLLRSDLYDDLLGDFAVEFRLAIVNFIHFREREKIRKQLKRMCQARERHVCLQREEPRYKNKAWQKAYRYATEEADIVEVIARFVEVKDPRRPIRCPFHEDSTPSFRIYEDTRSFHCYGCQAHGSAIDFVMKIKGCSFREAVRTISTF